ncbi:MAG TPA: glycoside hydrolase family 43 protein [Candidatus Limnocylindria bacterium]|nr:glycoside hydrolase family 43 protein [Candidatus Limnocylindria bacterium]
MRQAWLFVHFREKKTPDGEQVHFAVSGDGLRWQALNGGRPVLWSYRGDLGVRDMCVLRCHDGLFRLFATDLSLAYGMPGKYQGSWDNVARRGSDCLMCWESADLVHWGKQGELRFPGTGFGCMWAPDCVKNDESGEYLLSWSSTRRGEGKPHDVWYSLTRDFREWSAPRVLLEGPAIDSAMVQEGGVWYLFVKGGTNPAGVTMLRGESFTGPFLPLQGGVRGLPEAEAAWYEAPAVYRLPDGRWVLMLDYYGVPGKGQGYVPFLAGTLADGRFTRAQEGFSFPYGFKHGTVMPITPEEFGRLLAVGEWPEEGG